MASPSILGARLPALWHTAPTARRRCPIDAHAQDQASTWADSWLEEDEHVRSARDKGAELGCTGVTRATANFLTLLAATIQARNVVEVGTGTGIAAAALLAGMEPSGVLTTIDLEAEHQRIARETLVALGYDHVQMRLIAGRALDVLPRLNDASYDLMFVNGDRTEYPALLHQAHRLLRPGGIVVFDRMLENGGIANSGDRDPDAVAVRDTAGAIKEGGDWLPAMLEVGSGLLIASLRRQPEQTD